MITLESIIGETSDLYQHEAETRKELERIQEDCHFKFKKIDERVASIASEFFQIKTGSYVFLSGQEAEGWYVINGMTGYLEKYPNGIQVTLVIEVNEIGKKKKSIGREKSFHLVINRQNSLDYRHACILDKADNEIEFLRKKS